MRGSTAKDRRNITAKTVQYLYDKLSSLILEVKTLLPHERA